MTINKKSFVIIAAIACFAGCAGDFLTMFVLGNFYPGYNQLFNTMSSLGESTSPVSGIISTWWVVMGFLMVLFAAGLNKAFISDNKFVKIATWLIILYGVGEGIGSGLFKANHLNNWLTPSGIVHEIVGGIGIVAIWILPLVMRKIIPLTAAPGFHRFSLFVFFAGAVFLILFLFRFVQNGNNLLAQFKGLWQRLFVLDYYLYLIVIAVIMIKNSRLHPNNSEYEQDQT